MSCRARVGLNYSPTSPIQRHRLSLPNSNIRWLYEHYTYDMPRIKVTRLEWQAVGRTSKSGDRQMLHYVGDSFTHRSLFRRNNEKESFS